MILYLQNQTGKRLRLACAMLFLAGQILSEALPAFSQTALTAIPAAQISRALPVDQMILPENEGIVETLHRGTKPGWVAIIKDAHAVPQAQTAIDRVLSRLIHKHGFDWVGVEGAAGIFQTQLFQTFPDSKKLHESLRPFIERGELGGAAIAALTSSDSAVYEGLEEPAAYESELRNYQAAFKQRPEWFAQINTVERKIDPLKKKYYSLAAKNWDLLAERLDSPEEDHQAWASMLFEMRHRIPYFPKRYPHLNALWIQMRLSRAGMNSIHGHIQKWKEAAEKKVPALKQKTDWQASGQAWMTGALSDFEYASKIDQISREMGLETQLPEPLAALVHLSRHIQDLKSGAWIQEWENARDEAEKNIFQSKAERQVSVLDKTAKLLKNAAELKVSRKDWEKLAAETPAGKREPEIQDAAQSLAAIHKKLVVAAPALFYRDAVRREASFENKINKQFKKNKAKHAALVVGGFHADVLAEALRKEGISFAVILPAIGQVPAETRYENLMRGDVSWRAYFKTENGRIKVYESFASAMISRLLDLKAQKQNPEKVLAHFKSWRENLIRGALGKEKSRESFDALNLLDREVLSGLYGSAFDRALQKNTVHQPGAASFVSPRDAFRAAAGMTSQAWAAAPLGDMTVDAEEVQPQRLASQVVLRAGDRSEVSMPRAEARLIDELQKFWKGKELSKAEFKSLEGLNQDFDPAKTIPSQWPNKTSVEMRSKKSGGREYLFFVENNTDRVAESRFLINEAISAKEANDVYMFEEVIAYEKDTEGDRPLTRSAPMFLTGEEVFKMGLGTQGTISPNSTHIYRLTKVTDNIPAVDSDDYLFLLKGSLLRYRGYGLKERSRFSFIMQEFARTLNNSRGTSYSDFKNLVEQLSKIIDESGSTFFAGDIASVLSDLVIARPDLEAVLFSHLTGVSNQDQMENPKAANLATQMMLTLKFSDFMMVSPESPPGGATGGLAKKTYEHAVQMARLGFNVSFFTGFYGSPEEKAAMIEKYSMTDSGRSVFVDFDNNGTTETAEIKIWKARIDGVRMYFLENDKYFDALQPGKARDPNHAAYGNDDGFRARFSRALSLGSLLAAREMNLHPHIVEGNDWATGFLPLYLHGGDGLHYHGENSLDKDPHFEYAKTNFVAHNLDGKYHGRVYGKTDEDLKAKMWHDFGLKAADWDSSVIWGQTVHLFGKEIKMPWVKDGQRSIDPVFAAHRHYDFTNTVSRGYHQAGLVNTEKNVTDFGYLTPLLIARDEAGISFGEPNGFELVGQQKKLFESMLPDEEVLTRARKALDYYRASPDHAPLLAKRELYIPFLEKWIANPVSIPPRSLLEMGDDEEKKLYAQINFEFFQPVLKERLQKELKLDASDPEAVLGIAAHRMDIQKGQHGMLVPVWNKDHPDFLISELSKHFDFSGNGGSAPMHDLFEEAAPAQLTPDQAQALQRFSGEHGKHTLTAIEVALILNPHLQIALTGLLPAWSTYYEFVEIEKLFYGRFRPMNRFIDPVREAELYFMLYAGADLFLMPSFFEPGGLSNQEAAGYGVIRHLSNRHGLIDGAVREAEIDEAFDPYNPAIWAASLVKLSEIKKHNPKLWIETQYRLITQDNRWLSRLRDYLTDIYWPVLGVKPPKDLTALEMGAALQQAITAAIGNNRAAKIFGETPDLKALSQEEWRKMLTLAKDEIAKAGYLWKKDLSKHPSLADEFLLALRSSENDFLATQITQFYLPLAGLDPDFNRIFMEQVEIELEKNMQQDRRFVNRFLSAKIGLDAAAEVARSESRGDDDRQPQRFRSRSIHDYYSPLTANPLAHNLYQARHLRQPFSLITTIQRLSSPNAHEVFRKEIKSIARWSVKTVERFFSPDDRKPLMAFILMTAPDLFPYTQKWHYEFFNKLEGLRLRNPHFFNGEALPTVIDANQGLVLARKASADSDEVLVMSIAFSAEEEVYLRNRHVDRDGKIDIRVGVHPDKRHPSKESNGGSVVPSWFGEWQGGHSAPYGDDLTTIIHPGVTVDISDGLYTLLNYGQRDDLLNENGWTIKVPIHEPGKREKRADQVQALILKPTTAPPKGSLTSYLKSETGLIFAAHEDGSYTAMIKDTEALFKVHEAVRSYGYVAALESVLKAESFQHLKFPVRIRLYPREIKGPALRLSQKIDALFHHQLKVGTFERPDGLSHWTPFMKIVEDGTTVTYAVVIDGKAKLFEGVIPEDFLARAEYVFILNADRTKRPGVKSVLPKMRPTDEPGHVAAAAMQISPIYIQGQIPDEMYFYAAGPSKQRWMMVANRFPVLPPRLNYSQKSQPQEMVISHAVEKGQTSYPQSKMHAPENIWDLISMHAELDGSIYEQGNNRALANAVSSVMESIFNAGKPDAYNLLITGNERVIAVNGYHPPNAPGAVDGGATQLHGHARLLRTRLPIQNLGEDAFVSIGSFRAGTEMIEVKTMNADGETALVFERKGQKIFVFSRPNAMPEGFTSIWSFMEMGRAIVIEDIARFFKLTPAELIKLRKAASPAEWLRQNKRRLHKQGIHPDLIGLAKSAFASGAQSVTESSEHMDKLARAVIKEKGGTLRAEMRQRSALQMLVETGHAAAKINRLRPNDFVPAVISGGNEAAAIQNPGAPQTDTVSRLIQSLDDAAEKHFSKYPNEPLHLGFEMAYDSHAENEMLGLAEKIQSLKSHYGDLVQNHFKVLLTPGQLELPQIKLFVGKLKAKGSAAKEISNAVQLSKELESRHIFAYGLENLDLDVTDLFGHVRYLTVATGALSMRDVFPAALMLNLYTASYASLTESDLVKAVNQFKNVFELRGNRLTLLAEFLKAEIFEAQVSRLFASMA